MTNRCLQGPLLGPGYWVTRLALGAPVDALPVPIAPTAPEPLVTVVSTPLKLPGYAPDLGQGRAEPIGNP